MPERDNTGNGVRLTKPPGLYSRNSILPILNYCKILYNSNPCPRRLTTKICDNVLR